MFKIGDTVSCSGFGLGTILEIENQDCAGRSLNFYVVANFNRTEKIKISAQGQSQGKIRSLPLNKEVGEILLILNGQKLTSIEGTNRTFYINLVKMFKTGSLENTALVVRSMAEKTKTRKLRVEERKLFDKAIAQLVEEMSFVQNADAATTEQLVYSTLGIGPLK